MLLASTAMPIKAGQHLGSDLPLLGDFMTAGRLVKAGDIAAAAGRLGEARKDYQNALAASPCYEEAELGIARCAVAEGDFKAAITDFQATLLGRDENFNIDLLTEYGLALSQGGQGQEAASVYNHVVDLCKHGRSLTKMEILPPVFRLDGSDYSPSRMQAMTHLIRALNARTLDAGRISDEMQKAVTLAPDSSLVYFYQGVLLNHMSKTGAKDAFLHALTLDDGSNAKIINKWIALAKS